MNFISLSQVLLLQQRISDMDLRKVQLQEDKRATASTVGKMMNVNMNHAPGAQTSRFIAACIAELNNKIKALDSELTTLNTSIAMHKADLAQEKNNLRQDQQSA